MISFIGGFGVRKLWVLVGIVGLVVLAGCGDGGTGSVSTGTTPVGAVASVTVGPSLAKAVLAASDLVVGENRFVFGLLDSATGQPISYVPQTSIQFFKVNDDGTATKTGDGEVIYRSENLPAGLYIVQTTFDKPGNWGALVTVKPENAEAYSQQMNFAVATDSAIPLPGEAAPLSKNLTVKDGTAIGDICSAQPHDDMHAMTIEEAVKSGKPSIILFAAPGFCPSFTCGPDLELVQKIEEKYRDKANFLHIEAPNEIQNHSHEGPVDENHNQETGHQGVSKPQVEVAREWGLKTEPWLFIVDKDGKVASRFEGGLTLDEVMPAFEKVVQ